MTRTENVRLNVGAGKNRIEGFHMKRADIILDLGEGRLPFDDNSVDLGGNTFITRKVARWWGGV